jgi:hypothetical protein
MPNIKAIRQKIQKTFFIKLTSVSKPWGGVPLGGPWGEDKLVTSWVHLYQWGDAIGVRGDREATSLENQLILPF